MMNTEDQFSVLPAQESYSSFDTSCLTQAISDMYPHDFDLMGFYPEYSFPSNPFYFSDQYQTPVDFVSPGEISSPSLPPSPLSSAGDLDLAFVNTEAKPARPTKTDLEGFEYNHTIRKWVCTKCEGDFVSTHEARRHVKTAAKCTGKKVMCQRCDDRIHASPYSRKRHFASKKCQKKGRKRGVPTYTVNNAFKEL